MAFWMHSQHLLLLRILVFLAAALPPPCLYHPPSALYLADLAFVFSWKCWSGSVQELPKELHGVFQGTLVTPIKRVPCSMLGGKQIDGGQIFVLRAALTPWGKTISVSLHSYPVSFYSCNVNSGSWPVFFCRGAPWTLVVASAPNVLGELGVHLYLGEL